MIQIAAESGLWDAARQHLDERAEQVGFFLAHWSPVKRQFMIRAWRPIHEEAAEANGQLHVSLPDETRSEIIQWAWTEDACLIEAHSHGRWSPAAFSAYDLRNLKEWVPHLWWRLRGRPYAAIVTSARDLDALAWVISPGEVEQVDGIATVAYYPSTRVTLSFNLSGENG